ncbi:transcriptional regulator, partial [Streptomyces sp. TRM76130]|nr:transcriptional regulator [Streptomyces sp. TRM76130]
ARRPSGPVLPELDDLQASIGDGGEWIVTAEVKLPRGGAELPLMVPVAQLDVRSGARPRLDWAELTALDGCEVANGVVTFAPGARRATFRGVTDVSSHPVRTVFSRLVLELRTERGE